MDMIPRNDYGERCQFDAYCKINRRQEVDIYYKGIGILEMSKVFDSRQK